MGTAGEYAGIDTSGGSLDVLVYTTGELRSFAYDQDGIDRAIAWLKEVRPALTVVEATGGPEIQLYIGLQGAGLAVAVVQPRRIRDFAKSVGILSRGNKVDARTLARYGATIQPEAYTMPDAVSQYLEALVTRRSQLMEMIIMETQRLVPSGDRTTNDWIRAHIEWLRNDIGHLDESISQVMQDNPVWRPKDEKSDVPGPAASPDKAPEAGQTHS